jgi:hypothetical protein
MNGAEAIKRAKGWCREVSEELPEISGLPCREGINAGQGLDVCWLLWRQSLAALANEVSKAGCFGDRDLGEWLLLRDKY